MSNVTIAYNGLRATISKEAIEDCAAMGFNIPAILATSSRRITRGRDDVEPVEVRISLFFEGVDHDGGHSYVVKVTPK